MKNLMKMVLFLALAAAAAGCLPEYPNCDADKDCHEGEYCVNRLCQQCRDDADCVEGQRCVEGACEAIAGFCKTAGDCPEGQVCKDSACAPCAVSGECPSGQACVEGRCQAADCVTDEDCGPGEVCRDGACGPPESNLGASEGCVPETVYFAFDSSEIDSDARLALQENAQCLKTKTGTVIVEGHCDPRGTTEYNMALGDRRARGVKKYLTSLGVGDSLLRPISKGEEESQGTDETGWAKDRKAEFK